MSPSQSFDFQAAFDGLHAEIQELRKDVKADLDTLAREMRSDFATKETVRLMIEPLKEEIDEIKTDRGVAITRTVSIGGMLLGAISILNSWFHFIR